MANIHISKVSIRNFRNYKSLDINTNSKQVVFGENETGKSNYIYALQLILDPSLSDNDRYLSITDFNNEIIDPIESKAEILISIFLSDFESSKTILAQLSDAVVDIDGEKYIKITYKYFPEEKEEGEFEYKYTIYKGDDENNRFDYRDRKYLLLKVIKPLRDVDFDLKNLKTSPLKKLIERYEIESTKLKTIAEAMKEQSLNLLDIDEINNLSKLIENELISILGKTNDLSVSFSMAEVDSVKILNALKMMLSGRILEEKSLGLKNVLYITMLLLQYSEELVPTLIKERNFVKYVDIDSDTLFQDSYKKTSEGNFVLTNFERYEELATFFIENQKIGKPQVIIAIEEPEAHLHPILQRLVFRNVIYENEQSVILTTHSTHIVSITPLEYMVHALKINNISSNITTYMGLEISDSDKKDIERYIDVKRGELYFGKGVILVEGIAEEYLIPKFAKLLDISLDENGIVVCSVDSTNFFPYRVFLNKLNIPNIILTDGDFYYLNSDESREYHSLYSSDESRDFGYLGIELSKKLLSKNGIDIDSNKDIVQQRKEIENSGIFIGEYTLEIDIFLQSIEEHEATTKIINAYNDISLGGEKQKENFKRELESKEFFKCLSKIESQGIGKGRFAQRFSNECVVSNIPDYIKRALSSIIELCC